MEKEQKEIQALSQRILAKAAHKVGGVAALSKFLGVGEATLADWLAGKHVPPVEIIMKATGPLVDEPMASWRNSPERNGIVDSSGTD